MSKKIETNDNFHYKSIISNINNYAQAIESKNTNTDLESCDYNILFLLTESDSKTVIRVADYLIDNEILIHQIRIPTAAIIGRLAIAISHTNEAKKKYYRFFIESFSDPNPPIESELLIGDPR